MKKYFFILMIIFGMQTNAQDWKLVWSDEFDSLNINKNNWKFEIGNNNGWGNNELQYYTNRADNSTIKDGNLLIIAKQELYGGKNYTSARLKTQDLKSFKYGKIEGRIKLPAQQGIWPAFWTLGTNINQVGWPKCGEIDIMEHINKVNYVNGTLHWDNSGHASYGKTITCDVTKYHVYSIEWNENAIKWFVDGNKYCEINIANNAGGTEEVHNPMFILLNLAVGGNWPGNPDGTTVFPDTMFVDYVRVYQTGVTSGSALQKKEGFSMEQNYPNPFNSTTTFSYSIPSTSSVSLKVFDANGREVSTIVNEKMQTGKHEREWNGAGFPGGVYYCKLQAGQFEETKRIVLLR